MHESGRYKKTLKDLIAAGTQHADADENFDILRGLTGVARYFVAAVCQHMHVQLVCIYN